MLDPMDPTGEPDGTTQWAEMIRPTVLKLFPDAKRIYGGWSLKTANGYRLDLWMMLFNVRLAEAEEDDWFTVGRYWCYPKDRIATALMAAVPFNMLPNDEPIGWIKSWDQRYNGDGPVGHRA